MVLYFDAPNSSVLQTALPTEVRCGVLLCRGIVECYVVVVLWRCGVSIPSSPCVRPKRPRVSVQNVYSVHRQHTHMLKHMCAWCRYTRGRFGRTHGDVLNVHTGTLNKHTGAREGVNVSAAHQNWPTLGYHVPQKFTESDHWMLPILQFENRSRTTRYRVLQSFVLPAEAFKLQLS